jgi:PLP dependent protein
MSITLNLLSLRNEIPSSVKLIAISKTKSVEQIMEAYRAGQRVFGENKVQELLPKYELLPKDIEWHLVGHLQTNKVKYIASLIDLIHSIDSLSLLREVDKQGRKINKVVKCLLQVYIAKEETKFGMDEKELLEMLSSPGFLACENVEVVGLMGMATYTDNEAQIRKEFRSLFQLFNKLKSSVFIDKPSFKEISMGMSSDYKIAIEEGSTMVRVGSKIFGEREIAAT